jgi:hypothetical protein
MPWQRIYIVVAILCTLALRDGYTHRGARAGLPDPVQYWMDLAGDTVTAAVFLLATQILALNLEPAAALPSCVLYYGSLICLPLISILRAALRPKPNFKAPFEPGMPPQKVYRLIWLLNLLWFVTIFLVVALYTSDVRGSRIDFLRGCLLPFICLLWICVQRNALNRRSKLIIIFKDLAKQALARRLETLPQGLKRHEPLYWWMVVFEVMIFTVPGGSLANELWNWLSGAHGGSFFRTELGVLAFAVSVLTWRYVKQCNRAAARAIKAAIDAPAGL